jgi:hypothetical protein
MNQYLTILERKDLGLANIDRVVSSKVCKIGIGIKIGKLTMESESESEESAGIG